MIRGLAVFLLLAGLGAALPARAQMPFIQGLMEALEQSGEANPEVKRSLGCMAGAGVTGAAALIYSQTQFVVIEGAVAGAAPYFAVPLFVATLVTGCSLGQSLAPAVEWLKVKASAIVEAAVPKLP
ncbi:MAG: hypothetical protein OHK0024_22540 [Thalassobaculales bacterium]